MQDGLHSGFELFGLLTDTFDKIVFLEGAKDRQHFLLVAVGGLPEWVFVVFFTGGIDSLTDETLCLNGLLEEFLPLLGGKGF
jgi:hypothetical protein